MTQMVKNLPAMRETRVPSLGRKDPLEKGMATPSGILDWRIPGTEKPGGLPPTGPHRAEHWVTNTTPLLPLLLNNPTAATASWRTQAYKTASQKALRECSQEGQEESDCIGILQ